MKYIVFALLIVFAAGCTKTKSVPDIVTGLTVNIGFDSLSLDSPSNTYGSVYKGIPASNHHGNNDKAMQFSRTDSAYVDFGALSGASFNKVFTICCWVEVSDTSDAIAILSKRGISGPFEYSLDNHFDHNILNLDNWVSNGATSVYGIDPLKASAQIQPNVWQHIAYVADGTMLKVYINGVLQGNTDQYNDGLALSATNASLVIANGGAWGKNYFFDGKIDNVRMYNRALPAAAISYLAGL
ncbi:MAG TPA: LamG domain-containing protein [Chitinophagales bacterium]|nr:LamG domain-containing protein [Chitinophagales bacterium]